MSLARNLGLFVGHIAKAIARDAGDRRGERGAKAQGAGGQVAGERREVGRREMEARTLVETAEGPREVLLRRTVIDEVEVREEAGREGGGRGA